MKTIINNWYYVSIGFAAVFACILFVGDWTMTQYYLLASSLFLCLHFFEEFGYPGGFPLLGAKTMLGMDTPDKESIGCNNLSACLSNWLLLVLVYLLPLFFPGVRFFLIGAVVLSLGEIFMHLLLFNVKLKTLYNPGLVTGLFGIGTVGIIYLIKGFNPGLYVWYDYVLGFIWFAVCFGFCFRSPLYWKIGKVKGYPMTDRTAYGLDMKKMEQADQTV